MKKWYKDLLKNLWLFIKANCLKIFEITIIWGFWIFLTIQANNIISKSNDISFENRQFEEIKFLDNKILESNRLTSDLYDETIWSD